jgi:predicted HTH transcriptional regulator
MHLSTKIFWKQEQDLIEIYADRIEISFENPGLSFPLITPDRFIWIPI